MGATVASYDPDLGATKPDDEGDLLTPKIAALFRRGFGVQPDAKAQGQKDGLAQLDNSGADIPAHANSKGERVDPNVVRYFQSQTDLRSGKNPASTVKSFASADDMNRPSFDVNASQGQTTVVTSRATTGMVLPPGIDPGSAEALKYLPPVQTITGGARPSPSRAATGLSFAWGGGKPHPVDPVRDAASIAAGRPGTQTIYDPSRLTDAHVTMDTSGKGGFVLPPQTPEGGTDWSKVANPMAFSAFRELPQQMMTALLSKDPLAIEKAKASIEAQKAGQTATATGEAGLAIQAKKRQQYEGAVDRMHQLAAQQIEAVRNLPEVQRGNATQKILSDLTAAKTQLQAEFGFQPRPLGMGGMFGGMSPGLDIGGYPSPY
jgi:hypothetical protein